MELLKCINLNKKFGEKHVLKNVKGLKVDVTNPDTLLCVEVRESAYVYIEKILMHLLFQQDLGFQNV